MSVKYERKKRKCDCSFNKGDCYCGVSPTEKKKVSTHKRNTDFSKKDNIKKKVVCSYTIRREVLLEFENICVGLGLDNMSHAVEGLMERFIDEVRGKDLKIDLK